MPVGQMLASMTSNEFEEWKYYDANIEMIGSQRDDLRMGLAISPLLNLLYHVHLKDPVLTKPTDWLMDLTQVFGNAKLKPKQTPEEMKAVLHQLRDAMVANEARKALVRKAHHRANQAALEQAQQNLKKR